MSNQISYSSKKSQHLMMCCCCCCCEKNNYSGMPWCNWFYRSKSIEKPFQNLFWKGFFYLMKFVLWNLFWNLMNST